MSGADLPGRRRSGGTGRRAGLKIPCPQGREGSSPSSGTKTNPRAGIEKMSALFVCLGAQEGLERARGAPLPDESRSLGYPAPIDRELGRDLHRLDEGNRKILLPDGKGDLCTSGQNGFGAFADEVFRRLEESVSGLA